LAGEIPALGIPLPGGGFLTPGGPDGRLSLSQLGAGCLEAGAGSAVDGGLLSIGAGDVPGILERAGCDTRKGQGSALEAVGNLSGGWVLVVVQGRLLRSPVPQDRSSDPPPKESRRTCCGSRLSLPWPGRQSKQDAPTYGSVPLH